MFAKVISGAVLGVDGYSVTVETDISQGLPSFDIVGLPGSGIREAKERVRAAFKNSGYPFPVKRITINLAPADTKKEGPSFDLAIAVGLLCAAGHISAVSIQNAFFAGELSLDGSLRPVRGILPMIYSARQSNISSCFVPWENRHEAALVDGIKVFGIRSLSELTEALNKNNLTSFTEEAPPKISVRDDAQADFSDVKGQEAVKRAFEVAAAGGHNLIMIGPPGSGKTMMAKRLPGILPDLSFEESLEVTKINSVSGMLGGSASLISKRPFRAPHHTLSYSALTGGGQTLKPGELSLAHKGVLFLDELTEFHRNVLEVLRQPLEDKRIVISRASGTALYPADFILVCAANPCPCGYYGNDEKCSCSQNQVAKYFGKISGPLLDRIDIQIETSKVDYEDLHSQKRPETSETIRARVVKARGIQAKRYGAPLLNASLDNRLIEKYCSVGQSEQELLKRVFNSLDLSARAYHKILKLARTVADLDGSENINSLHLSEAIQYRSLDRTYGNL